MGEKFTPQQATAAAILVVVKAAEELAHQGFAPGEAPHAYPYEGGKEWFRRFVAQYAGEVIPEFPDGIPAEAMEAVTPVFLRLLESGIIP